MGEGSVFPVSHREWLFPVFLLAIKLAEFSE